MRSATPKHLHAILGRSMVDWVVEAAKPLAPEPLVVVVSLETQQSVAGTRESPCRRSRAAQATPSARAAAALAPARTRRSFSPATDRSSRTELLEALLETHLARQAGSTGLSSRPTTSAATGGSSVTPTVTSRRSSNG